MSKRRKKVQETETYEEIVQAHEEELEEAQEKETKKEERKMKAKGILKKIGIVGGVAAAAAIGGYLFGNRKKYAEVDDDIEDLDEDDEFDRDDYIEINPTPDAD